MSSASRPVSGFAEGGAVLGYEPQEPSVLSAFDGFMVAAAGATPRGIVLVEEAIDKAIASIDQEILEIDPDSFGVEAFIPLAAFGTTARSPEIAVHHIRAHSVIAATLVGVREDLRHFKDACEMARRDMQAVDEGLVFDLAKYQAALDGIGAGLTGLALTAYEQAVEDAADLDISDTDTDGADGTDPSDDSDGDTATEEA